MATTIKIGEEVTIGETATEYVIDETYAVISKPFFDAPISTNSTNSGTIKFSIGEAPAAGQEAVASGQKKLICGIQNGFRNLWADASAAGQKFTVG